MSTNPENSPAPIIRRPVDVAIPTASNDLHVPAPNDPNESINRPTTPVLITPVNRRSTRELVVVPRVRSLTRIALSRRAPTRPASIRRRRAPSNDRIIPTRTTAPTARRSEDEKIDKTTTAIEYDPKETEIGERLAAFPSSTTFVNHSTNSLNIPSIETVESEVREINRLETVALAEKLLKNPATSLKELNDVLKSLFAQIDLMNAEMKMIDDVIERAMRSDNKMMEKVCLIEKIIKSDEE